MLLVVDAGNTNVKFGVFEGETLRVQWRLRMDHGRTADEYAALLYPLFAQAGLAFSDITGIALASVVPAATPALLRFFRHAFGREPLQVTGQTDIGLRVAYEPPDAVGADRLVDAVAAVHKYGAPCIVIDFGTATTFNAIAARSPVGGATSPCPSISAARSAWASASRWTPCSPAPPRSRPSRWPAPRAPSATTPPTPCNPASSTATPPSSPAWSPASAPRWTRPTCPVIATGGHAALIAHETDCITAVEPLLTLEGLRLVYAAPSDHDGR